MITLTAKIDLLSSNNSTLELVSNDLLGNNISSNLSNIVGVKKEVKNPFILGASKLGEGSTFSNGVNYFIGDQLSGKNGWFENAYTINLKSSVPIKSITIAFDTTNKRHPLQIGYKGTAYYDDDAIYTIVFDSEQTEHNIYIPNWNTPNAPIVITGIYTGVSINIDRRNLLSLERTIYDRADLKLPSFGIISNTGHIEFKDIDGEVRDYAEQRLLEKGMPCEIRLSNTLTKESVIVGKMETDEWDYDEENKTVGVSLKDDLEEWQEINIEGINYDPRSDEEMKFLELYKYLWNITREKGYNMKFAEILGAAYNILETTYIKYPFLKPCTLWQAWQKLCEVCQFHIFKNRQGVIECVYNGGN